MFCLPFELPGFIVTRVESEEKTVIIGATAQQTTAICPRCQQPSQSVHSYYQRSPQDLPVSGKTVRLVLRVRRFRCQNPQCSQRTFAERHPEVLASYAQRTERLSSTLVHFAGGERSEPAAPRHAPPRHHRESRYALTLSQARSRGAPGGSQSPGCR